MIIYDYVSRAKLKSNHIILSLKREYYNRRGMINVEARKEASKVVCSDSATSGPLLSCKLQRVETLCFGHVNVSLHRACEECHRHSFVEWNE